MTKSNCCCDNYNECCCPHDLRQNIFSKKYSQLWSILSTVGTSFSRGSGVSDTFPQPLKPVSKLIGTAVLTDPSSPVKILGFTIDTLDGPIQSIQNGFVMTTYSNAVKFKISYKIRKLNGKKPTSNVKIGFYTAPDFRFNRENRLFLITGSKGPSLFKSTKRNKHSGSFVGDFLNNIYVAVDKNVKVYIKVRAIIPEVVVIPLITKVTPYIEYIRVKQRIFPVAETILTSDCSSPNCTENTTLVKTPLHCFKQISEFINKYLDDTSLSITIFLDPVSEPVNTITYMFKDKLVIRVPGGGAFAVTPYITTNTESLGSTGIYHWWPDKVKEGIKLIPNANNNIFYKITYTVRLLLNFRDSFTYSACVSSLTLWGGAWYYQTNHNETTGMADGKTKKQFDNLQYRNEETLTGSFLLSGKEEGFNITVYICQIPQQIIADSATVNQFDITVEEVTIG